MTDNVALNAINLYLSGEIEFDDLQVRIIPLAWDADFDDQDLVDIVSIEIAYILDGVSDELIFRHRLAEVVMTRQDETTFINVVDESKGRVASQTLATLNSSSQTIEYEATLAIHNVEHSLAMQFA